MKRKLLSILLAVTLCLSLVVAVSAAHIDFIWDSLGVITKEEREYLNDMAMELYDEYGVGVFFDFTIAPILGEYNVSAKVRDMTDYYIMLENADSWYYFAGGKGELLDTDALRGVYDEEETYVGGVEAFLAEAMLQLSFLEEDPEDESEGDLLVWDDAGLLNQNEVSKLDATLQNISKEYNAEIHVVTISSMDGGDIDEFQHFLYDQMGFGYGENHDGVLLLVCMDPREYRILSNGFAGTAIDTDAIDSICDVIVSDLSDGNYYDAFDAFAQQCKYYLDGYVNGFPFDAGTSFLVAVGVGLLVAVVVTSIFKGQLKSVRKQAAANAYVKPGSLQLTQTGDFFMYSNITKTERQQSSSSSGSSGGSSRSTGGGSF